MFYLFFVFVLSLVCTSYTLAGIVYVDATEGEAGNTMLATGEVFASIDDQSGSDNLWRGRVFANEGTIFESGGQYGNTSNPEDCPRLMTSIDVPEGYYDVYVYIWADPAQWRIQASLENLEGDLPLYLCNDPNGEATLALSEDFEEPVPMLAEGNRTLWQIYLGTTGLTTMIDVFIDDDPNHQTHDGRTWYDGIGYKAAAAPEPGPKIIFVTSVKDNDMDGVQDDTSWLDWLTAEGYDVDFRPGNWIDPLDANDIAELEAADLIIASRGMATPEYDADEVPKWNAVSTPIICTNAWMIRNNRWLWMNSGSANKDAGSPFLLALETEHPIFEGVTLDSDGLAEILDPAVASGHTSFLNDILDVGNGTLIAQSLGVYNTVWIAEWQAGVEYYEGAGQIAGGPRILFMAGTQDDPYLAPDGVNIAPVGVLNLNDAGKQMFLNAIEYLLPAKPVDPGADNLVAYYPLDGDVLDSSGNGLDGTIMGDPNFVEGIIGMGLQLDGVDDYVDCGNNPLFDITEQITLATWVNVNDFGNGQNDPWVSKGDHGWAIKGHRNGFAIEFFVYEGTWNWIDVEVGDINNEWHHAAGTFDGTQLKIYLDGEVVSTKDYVGGIATTSYNVAIGANTEKGDRFSEGIRDEVRIYNRALSAEEILYIAGL